MKNERQAISKLIWIICFIISCCCSSCSVDLLAVKQSATLLDTTDASKQSWILTEPVSVKVDAWHKTPLKKGTEWVYVGKLDEGEVYKTGDQVVTIEGFDTFEVYLVVSGEKLAGFYLPVEKTIVQLKHSVPLKMKRSD
jgi:hypothetical protein